MSESTAPDSASVLELSPEERADLDITREDVQEALLDTIEHGSQQDKIFVDCTFPRLDFDYLEIDSENTHPVVFRNCTFTDGVSAIHAAIKLPVHLTGCTIAGMSLEQARFVYDVTFAESTFTEPMSAFEAAFDRGTNFTDTTFKAAVEMDEATFNDEALFTRTTFEDRASFRTAEFSGLSNALDDHASFEQAVFGAEANFRQTTFQFTTFHGATFHAHAQFQEAQFDGDVEFSEVTFHEETDFDETDFRRDVSFTDSAFHACAVFRGAEFEGGARTLQDDARFTNVVFHGDVNFRDAWCRYANFENATFGGHAMFEEMWFDEDADFTGCTFESDADFDEARFGGDADFSRTRFEQPTVFRGAEFRGEANYLEANATFEHAQFNDDADFDNATFTSANFRHTQFGGVVDFSGSEFTDDIDFLAEASDDDACVDFTRAVLKGGTITQPDDNWVRYDFTLASLGDLSLERTTDTDHYELLNYFRFCNTEFNEFDGNEFDFSAHTQYLDRNDWKLHTFTTVDSVDYEYALEMTPEVIETTYLKAKNAASDAGQIKAAGEFRILRQQYARRKHIDIARDKRVDARTRFKNLSRAVENYFLGITCGHGMRLIRIAVVFLIAPIFPALLYAFGGPLFRTSAGNLSSIQQLTTPDGLTTLYELIYFSYITFLTIGYGGIAPVGILARLLAGLEVYLSVILGGLVLYALIKRSEV
jgi:uncharacterized protein YjbI with pentapeptide repeats